MNDYSKGKINYSVSAVENNEGKFVCIHEKEENRAGNQTVCKGVAIPIELIDEIIAGISNISKIKESKSHLNEGHLNEDKEENKDEEDEKTDPSLF